MTGGAVLQPGHDDRATGRTTGGRAEGTSKFRPLGSQSIETWSHRHFISIGSNLEAKVVSNEQNDVLLGQVPLLKFA